MGPNCFVAWPDPGGAWRDSGLGGLFAYLVYRGLGIPERARVDVTGHLYTTTMPLNDALASQLWAPPRVGRPFDLLHDEEPLSPWSKELRCVIYLGSTQRSLVHTETGEHFQVRRENLTMDGDAIAHVLDYEYNWPGDILTFVGTEMEPAPLQEWLARTAERRWVGDIPAEPSHQRAPLTTTSAPPNRSGPLP